MSRMEPEPVILDARTHPVLPGFVRIAGMAVDGDPEAGADALLSGSEREEMERLGDPGRRREFRLSRLLLRRLADGEGIDPQELEVRREEGGRPYGICRGERVHLSVTHTDSRIACALSRSREVGLDMEPAGRRVDNRLRLRMLHPEESDVLQQVETIRIWTLKEALLKLQGRGLRTNMNELRIRPSGTNRFEEIFNNEIRAKICSFTHQGHWMALAYFT